MSIKNDAINKGIKYIIDNMEEELNVEEVAEYCNFSKYYFNRLFKEETGESIYSFIKRRKLEQSALDLGKYEKSTITEIGEKYGYSSSNFSTAFKKHYSLSPAKFKDMAKDKEFVRRNPFFNNMCNYKEFQHYNEQMSITNLKAFYVLYDRRIGSYTETYKNKEGFLNQYKHLIKEDTVFINICYDDPSVTPIDRCILDMCMSINEEVEIDNKMYIQGGKYAIYHFDGINNKIFEAFQGVFKIWLPNVGLELDNRPIFSVDRAENGKSNSVVMDLYFPIK